jgi:hypothetical protein
VVSAYKKWRIAEAASMAICQPLGAVGSPAVLNHRPVFGYSVSSKSTHLPE